MARTTGRSGFKLRSGNKTSFANMGSSSINVNNFGLAAHDSPLSKLSWEDALKNDPQLNQHVKERDKHKPGSEEYEKYQALINKAHGVERDQDLKKAQIDQVNKEEGGEPDGGEPDGDPNTETDPGVQTNIDGKPRPNWAGIGIAALTGGLDAVYGSGKILPAGSSRLVKNTKDDKKDDKDDKTIAENIIEGNPDDKKIKE